MILQQLKKRTAKLHEQIERTVDLPSRLRSADRYAALLGRFLGFYEPLEERLAAIDIAAAGLALAPRRKSAWLRADLASMRLTFEQIAALPRCPFLPDLIGTPDALGSMYVVEGATLGGQFVRREAAANLGVSPEQGCAFFTSYGDKVGAMWKEFCAALNTFADERPDETDRVAAAAAETFECLNRWIAEDASC